jgi:hypothetical protein
MSKNKIHQLAKLLSEIHSHSLYPHYSEIPSTFWAELENVSSDKEEVDKDFFIRISEDILKQLEDK